MSRSLGLMSSKTTGKFESTLRTALNRVLLSESPSSGSLTWPLESRWNAYLVRVPLPLPGSPYM